MTDMLVKLYNLPALQPALSNVAASGVGIRRADKNDELQICDWIKEHFGEQWALECKASFTLSSPCCFIAENEKVIGFACYNAAAKNYFGPTGVADAEQGKGVGSALLLSCLYELQNEGFAYAIIGGVGPQDFYARTVGASLIEGSDPGIYTKQWFNEMNPGTSD